MRWTIVVIPFGVSAPIITAATTPSAANPLTTSIISRRTAPARTTRTCSVPRHQYDKVNFLFCCYFKNHHDRLVGRKIIFLPRTQLRSIPILLCDDHNSATAIIVMEFIQTMITSSSMSRNAISTTFVSPITPPNDDGRHPTRMRRRKRPTDRKIHEHFIDMIQYFWNEILSCIPTIFAPIVNDVLLLLMSAYQRQSPVPSTMFQAWFDQWRTTLQQFWIYHHIAVSRMMAFIVEQTMSDDQSEDNNQAPPPTYRLRQGDNGRNRQAHVGSAAAITDEDTTMTSCDPSNNATMTIIDQFVTGRPDAAKTSSVGIGDVVHNRCDNKTDEIRPTIKLSMTVLPPPNDPQEVATTGPIVTTIIAEHDADDTAAVDRCLDWNDTITAFIIRLTMIAIMCYLIAISN